jgi:hypothetical protein
MRSTQLRVSFVLHQWLYSHLLGPGLFFCFLVFLTKTPIAPQPFGRWPHFSVSWSCTQSVALLRQGISPLQGRYLHTEQHKNRINAHRHPCLEWVSNPRSHCLSERRRFMRGHCDMLFNELLALIFSLYRSVQSFQILCHVIQGIRYTRTRALWELEWCKCFQ